MNDLDIFGGLAEFNGIGGEGLIGGGMIGYNHQIGSIVLGLQGEVGYNDTATDLEVIGGLIELDARQGLVAAISARLGLLLTPSTMAYVIGGYSYSEYETDISILGSSASFDENYDGFHVGGGLEAKVGASTSLRVEYRYTQYKSEDWGTGGAVEVAPSTHTGTVGLAYNFGSGGSAEAAMTAAPEGDWTGLYLGAYGGGGAVVNDLDIFGGLADFNGIGGEGLIGGGMIGYNHQINSIVIGIQGEVGYSDLATNLDVAGGFLELDATQGLVASVSARLGLLVTPHTMAYVIGGYSHADYETDISILGSSASFDESYEGFHVGGGIEALIGSHASLRIEYRYTDLGSEDWGTGGAVEVSPSTHTGSVGLAWNL